MTWDIENGIGEIRKLLLDGDETLAAKTIWPGEWRTGDVVKVQLATKRAGARRGTARTQDGCEVLIDHLPKDVTEGAHLTATITRAAIAERGRLKLAQGRMIDSNMSHNETYLIDSDSLLSQNETYPPFRELGGAQVRAFPSATWEEVWHAASSGKIAFSDGEILCSATPAMTVIDIDGDAPPRELALAAVPAIARAIRWFDLGGNIGIDFPTLQSKADRRAVDEAIDNTLKDWPHERTAMNGFGFVQIVARLEGPSLLHRFASSRTGMCARFALRVGERAQGTGPTLLVTVHPALKSKLKAEWIDELARRTGKQVRIETNPSLALEAPQAQIVEQ